MKFALVRGKSPVSSIIQWWTRSVYSHVALVLEDGTTYEALPSGFVRAPACTPTTTAAPSTCSATNPPHPGRAGHRPPGPGEHGRRALRLPHAPGLPLAHQLGTAHQPAQALLQRSRLPGLLALGPTRLLLERTQPWKVTPDMVNLSPLLQWDKTLSLLMNATRHFRNTQSHKFTHIC